MYKYDIQNMYYGSEISSKYFVKQIQNNNNIINIKPRHVFLSQHVVKNLRSMTPKKLLKKV
jgi:hypothetical protein